MLFSLKSQPLRMILVSAISLSFSKNAFALMDGEAFLGVRKSRWSSGDSTSDLQSKILGVGLHLDPIPAVPVGFGARLYVEKFDTSVGSQGLKSLNSASLVPEIVAWIPLDGNLKPMARLGYGVTGYLGEAEVAVANSTSSGVVRMQGRGLHIGVGFDWSLIPLVSLTVMVEHAREAVTVTGGEINGVSMKDRFQDTKIQGNALIIGGKLGL